MWPKYLDIDSKTCAGILRKLELETYSSVISTLRAQGELTKERRKVMNDLGNILNIPIERHKAEIRRAINEELLNTIAASVCGNVNNEVEWAKEGRRIIPLLNRATPITAYTKIAEEGAENAASVNKTLASPLNTKSETKRKSYSSGDSVKYSQRTPPKDLKEMVTRVKDEENDSVHALVRTPPTAVPTPPSPVKQHNNLLGGDVMVLPSGKAIRLNADKLNEINEAIDALTKKPEPRGNRKRKPSIDSIGENASGPGQGGSAPKKSPAFEILSKQALMKMIPPPPPMPPRTPAGLQPGILGQQLMTPPRAPITPRGSTRGRRGVGSRGGRRGRTPRGMSGSNPRMIVPPPPPLPSQPSLNVPAPGSNPAPTPPVSMSSGLAMLAQAINHQQGQDKVTAAISTTSSSGSSGITSTNTVTAVTASVTSSEPLKEPPQVTITPPKVVVVTTPSVTVLRPNISTSTTTPMTTPNTTTSTTTSIPYIVASTSAMTAGNNSSLAPKTNRPGIIPQTVKLKVGDSPMKVYPVGAKILPAGTATSGSSGPAGVGATGSPVFMVAAPMSQNTLMRVARTTAQTATLTGSGQRVVTVNTASLRPPVHGGNNGPGAVTIPTTIKALQPRVVTSVGSLGGGGGVASKSTLTPVSVTSSKPSVIVVQRSGVSGGATLLAKDSISASGGQRIFTSKSSVKQPIVIVSKGSTLAASVASTSSSIVSSSASMIESAAPTSTAQHMATGSQMGNNATGNQNVITTIGNVIATGNQNTGNVIATGSLQNTATGNVITTGNQNVIVLDLNQDISSTTTVSTTATLPSGGNGSQQQATGNNVLSDILQMTGIMSEPEVEVEQQQQQLPVVTNSNNDIQQRLAKNTTTLQKVPDDSSAWIVLDEAANGTGNAGAKDVVENFVNETGNGKTATGSSTAGNQFTENLDIFSQAMASAEIGDFSASPHDVMPTLHHRSNVN